MGTQSRKQFICGKYMSEIIELAPSVTRLATQIFSFLICDPLHSSCCLL